MARKRLLGIMAIAAIIAVVAVYAVAIRGEGGDGWKTFRSERFGYQIRYPANWVIAGGREPQSGDDFVAQNIGLMSRESATATIPAVMVAVNFQGDWCTSGTQTQTQVSLARHSGTRYECDWQPDGHVDEIVLFFDRPAEAPTFWVSAFSPPSSKEEDIVRRVIDSFRFIEGER